MNKWINEKYGPFTVPYQDEKTSKRSATCNVIKKMPGNVPEYHGLKRKSQSAPPAAAPKGAFSWQSPVAL
jgi:hypothetical protein